MNARSGRNATTLRTKLSEEVDGPKREKAILVRLFCGCWAGLNLASSGFVLRRASGPGCRLDRKVIFNCGDRGRRKKRDCHYFMQELHLRYAR
jgi:hypothetical protein